MDRATISQILYELFSDGYKADNFNIRCESPTTVEIIKDISGVLIKFNNTLPRVEIKKFIKFKLNVEAISFGRNGGIIKIKNFPDMPFSYDNNKNVELYGNSIHIDISEEEIDQVFKSQSKRKIASKCLHYAKEWATIASLNGVRFDNYDKFDAFVLKKQCYYFIEDAIKNDEDLKYGSFISIFILSLILPSIIRWAVDRIIRSLLT